MSTPLKGLDRATPTPPKPQSQGVADMAGDQLEELVDENADSTDSNVRYAAYLRRARDIVRAGSRYTAYTSDIGEAFRPVVPPAVVTAAYGISWAYLIGDVGFTSYKAQQQGPTAWEASKMSEPTRLGLITVKRAVFQGVASMALPAFTIHSAVKYAGRQFAKSSNVTLRRWGPTAVGIGIVPFLPYMFDEPVEHVVDYSFEKIEEHFFGHRDDLPSATPVSSVQSQLPPKKEL